MGLAEKLSEWLLRRRERQEERNMRQVAAYFGSLLNKRRADAGAILQSVRDYRDCPEVTRKQAELLLEHRFFRYVYQTGYPEWRAVMDALKETRYGMREGAAIPRSVREAAESPMLRLAAQYKVLEYENTRRNAPQPLSPEAQAERDAAHRLLNCCMREGDLDALKRLALKGEKPDDSIAIRHGLAEGYRRLEELSREWSEEMRGDNHTVMEQIELREADDVKSMLKDPYIFDMLTFKSKDRIKAEYALRDIQKPIGISDYELGQALPKDFRGSLPTIEEIEKELESNRE